MIMSVLRLSDLGTFHFTTFIWKISVRFLPMILAAQYAEPSERLARWWLEVILTVGCQECQDVKFKHHYDNPGQYGHTKIL